jgi:hypothetical protein
MTRWDFDDMDIDSISSIDYTDDDSSTDDGESSTVDDESMADDDDSASTDYDGDDVDDDERHEQAVLAAALAVQRLYFEEQRQQRKFKYQRERVNWHQLVHYLEHTEQFRPMFRMSREAFDGLVSVLGERIELDAIKSLNSTPGSDDRIYPELVVAVGLRILTGVASPHDIHLWAGISKASVYRLRDIFLNAVIDVDDLAVDWPDSPERCWVLAQGFKNLSSHGVMDKVVGALDGVLIPIKQPVGVLNPRSFYSGHYRHHGINVQVVCDYRMRIL